MLNHQGSPVLSTQRLRLRPYRAGDGAQMFSAWAGDAQVTKYMGFSTHADPGVTERLAQLWAEGYESPTVYRWGVEYQGELAGDISVVRWNEEDSWCELGCCIARKYWNQGLMTEALTAALEYLFHTVGFHRVQMRHDALNPASGRVMQKCGLQLEGTLRGFKRRHDGTWADIRLYAALGESWQKP